MTHSAIAPRAPRMNFHTILPGQRVCQKCKRYTTAKGGKYEQLDRLHQRWICAGCVEKKEAVPPMHPMFAQMLGYAPAIVAAPPKVCTHTHILSDDATDVWVAEPTLNAILAVMQGEMCSKEIAEKTGLNRKTVARAVRQMNESGRIRFVRHSRYFGRMYVKTGDVA